MFFLFNFAVLIWKFGERKEIRVCCAGVMANDCSLCQNFNALFIAASVRVFYRLDMMMCPFGTVLDKNAPAVGLD